MSHVTYFVVIRLSSLTLPLACRKTRLVPRQAIQEANAQASARGLWADERHAADALDASGEAHAAT